MSAPPAGVGSEPDLASIGSGSGITRRLVVAFYTRLGNAGRKGDYGRTHTAAPQVSSGASSDFRAGRGRESRPFGGGREPRSGLSALHGVRKKGIGASGSPARRRT